MFDAKDDPGRCLSTWQTKDCLRKGKGAKLTYLYQYSRG
jgi:hypothetical protein